MWEGWQSCLLVENTKMSIPYKNLNIAVPYFTCSKLCDLSLVEPHKSSAELFQTRIFVFNQRVPYIRTLLL